MVPLSSRKVPRVSRYSGSCRGGPGFGYGALTLSGRLSQNLSPILSAPFSQSSTPGCTHPGLGSSGFARRYSRNRCFFLFLRLLRCFSSPGSPRTPMDSAYGGWSPSSRVSPFRYLRIAGYLLLPEAFRSLSRLSSALSAKASSLCSFLHDLFSLHPLRCRASPPSLRLAWRQGRSFGVLIRLLLKQPPRMSFLSFDI